MEALRVVDECEQDLDKLRQMVSLSGKTSLSSRSWRAINFQFHRLKDSLPERQEQVLRHVRTATPTGAPAPESACLESGLRDRLTACEISLHSMGMPWIGIARRLEVPSPSAPSGTVSLYRAVLPGTMLGSHLIGGYPSEEAMASQCAARYEHVPGLALAAATASGGAPLFGGLLHGFVPTEEIDGALLARMGEEELLAWVGERLDDRFKSGDDLESRRKLQAIRSSDADRASLAFALNGEVRTKVVAELASADVFLDPAPWLKSFERGSGPLEVNLFSIALLKPGDVEAWKRQHDCFNSYVDRAPLELHLIDPLGKPRGVEAAVRIRQFLLSAADERVDLQSPWRERQQEAVRRLLGPLDSADYLGGDVRRALKVMKDGYRLVKSTMVDQQLEVARLNRNPATKSGEVQANVDAFAQLARHCDSIAKAMCTLEEAGCRLKVIWAREGHWPTGDKARREVASLLALAGSLMGETPATSCGRTTDLAVSLNDATTALSAYANVNGGSLPGAVSRDGTEPRTR